MLVIDITLYIHNVIGSVGIITNLIVLMIILTRTPKEFQTYSIILINFAVFELLNCLLAIFAQPRLVAAGDVVACVVYGPCVFMGPFYSFICCILIIGINAHILNSNLLSFIYKYDTITTKKLSKQCLLVIIFLLLVPTSLMATLLIISYSNPEDVRKKATEALEHYYGNPFKETDSVMGVLNLMRPTVVASVMYMSLPVPLIYLMIVYYRYAILKKIGLSYLSLKTKKMQMDFVKVLTCQAMLPIFLFIAVTLYGIGQFDIYHHPIIEILPILCNTVAPSISPLLTLYFVRPYFFFVKDLFRRRSSHSVVSFVNIKTSV